MSTVQKLPTRDIIIQTAIELFGEKGFEATTTRDIASAANVNLGSLTYHFENKDGLYSAVIQELIGFVSPVLNQLEALLRQGKELAGNDPVRQSALVKRMVENALDTFLGNPKVRIILPLLMREFTRPSSHFDELYEALPRRFHETTTELVSWIDKTDPDSRTSIIRAHAFIGQIVIFHIGRFILQKRLSVTDLGDADIEEIKPVVVEVTLSSLGISPGEIL